ncbi:energy transducer TonB [Sphingomonas parva]|uniref:Energy transducer TonB n=1 Tax=Sphingomonas parva TaxID=2555898 RepID=A0A4Y8ZSS0_9SPHN|nr:energy transducer TonB [Sphingomonas parva]TFI58537.1 energy transducer TonB [Sphingomonas parva]
MVLSVSIALCCAGASPVLVRPLEALFTPRDYPLQALEAKQSGDVAVRLVVGTNGRVTGCTVLRSSGSPTLDSTTCRILFSRARVRPARGDDGAPMTSQHEYVQHWTLPAS